MRLICVHEVRWGDEAKYRLGVQTTWPWSWEVVRLAGGRHHDADLGSAAGLGARYLRRAARPRPAHLVWRDQDGARPFGEEAGANSHARRKSVYLQRAVESRRIHKIGNS